MNKRERVYKLLDGEKVDRIPAGFWLHFPKEKIAQGNAVLLEEHLRFKNETNVDILKIMNENEMRRSEKIVTSKDWRKLPKLTKESPLVLNQIELLKRVLEKNDGDCFTLATIHGVLASLSHSSGFSYSQAPAIFQQHYLEDKESLMEGVKIITENTEILIEESLKTGVDGIYYAALGGEVDKLTKDEFKGILEQSETNLLNIVKKSGKKVFLHMCKENVELERYQHYPADAVNWAMHESKYSIETALSIFPDKTILGGLDDRSGVLVDGTLDEVEKTVDALKNDFENTKFILGADCTLPTEINYKRIREVIEKL